MSAPNRNTVLTATRELVERGQRQDAQHLLERLIADDENDMDALLMLASINTDLGNYRSGRALLQRVFTLEPELPEAHFCLARILRGEGNLEEALTRLENAVKIKTEYVEAWTLLGSISGLLGRLERAEVAYRKAVALAPGSVENRTLLGNTLFYLRKYEESASTFRQLLEKQPDSVSSWYMLGCACSAVGRLDEAASAYRKALELNPAHADSRYGFAFIAYSQHKYPEAAEGFRQVLRLSPQNAQAHNGLATALQALGRYREALGHYDAAIKRVSIYADAHFGRGCTLIALGDTEGAIHSLREALRLNPKYVGAYISLASALMAHGNPEEALANCETALQISPNQPDAVALAATIEQHLGMVEQALQRLQPWIEQGIQDVNLAIAYAEVSKTLDRPDAAIELLERLLRRQQQLPVTSRRNLHFNLGRLYDKAGHYAQAFAHYRQGNAARLMDYDAAANSREIDAIIEVHSRDFLAAAPRAARRSNKPVFVVGMPRSGTSLVEQILASHPAVFGAGELPYLWQMAARLSQVLESPEAYPRCLPALRQHHVDTLAGEYLDHLEVLGPASSRVVDKMPGNFRFLGLIVLLFPAARIIHCLRDPLDTCLSCYFQDFSRTHAYSYDLAQLGRYYKDYRRLMDHWQAVLSVPVLDVHYEQLIENQEAVSRRLVEFIDLDWDDQCLNFHETDRFVATASYDQVRRPLYSRSVARWKHYEHHLGPLIEALK